LVNRKLGLVIACTLCLAYDSQTASIEASWDGGTGNWGDGAFWNFVPASGAVFPNNGVPDTFDVFIDGGNAIDSIVTLKIDVTVGALTIGSGDRLNLTNDRALSLENSLTNDGTIALTDNGSGNPAQIVIVDTVSYAGTGVFPNNFTANNRIIGGGTTPMLINQSDFILDAGIIVLDNLTVTNQDSLQANDGTRIVIDSDTTIVGGEINTLGTGIVRANSGATIEDTSIGFLQLLNDTTVNVKGSLTIDGAIQMNDNGSGDPTRLLLDGAVNYLGGTGAIEAISTTRNQVTGLVGASLNVLENLRFRGINGAFGRSTITDLDVTNEAHIVADNALLRLELSTIDNSLGTIEGINGATIEFGAGLNINDGVLHSDATSAFTTSAGGPSVDLTDVSFDGGSLLNISNDTGINLYGNFGHDGTINFSDNGSCGITELVVNGVVNHPRRNAHHPEQYLSESY
jgi:hypothetical protein